MRAALAAAAATVLALAGVARADPAAPAVPLAEARALFAVAPGGAPARCADVPCLIDHAYRRDPRARDLAHALFRERGDLAGAGAEEHMDGGYRGRIHLVPQLPLGDHRRHLAWTADALRSFDEFFAALFSGAPPPAYRWRGLQLRFVRSVGKRTPSAYALGWTITYNVAGSLLTTPAGVRETLFHELFHNNDLARGDWSARHLRRDYDTIVTRCGTEIRCLTPYAPNTTRVRGGTFYAFQPNNGNGVHEYAAEIAVRYWREHLELLRTRKLAKRPWKCGAPENARAWRAVVGEFFGGRDLTPAC